MPDLRLLQPRLPRSGVDHVLRISILFLRRQAEKLCEAVGCADPHVPSNRRFFDSLRHRFSGVCFLYFSCLSCFLRL